METGVGIVGLAPLTNFKIRENAITIVFFSLRDSDIHLRKVENSLERSNTFEYHYRHTSTTFPTFDFSDQIYSNSKPKTLFWLKVNFLVLQSIHCKIHYVLDSSRVRHYYHSGGGDT